MNEEFEKRWQKNWREGEEARRAVYEHLIARGHKATLTDQTSRPSWEVRTKYSDRGDLEIATDEGLRRIEVKRNMKWDAHYHLYLREKKWKSIILGKPYRLLQPVAGSQPLLAIVCVDSTLTRLVSIPASSREHWYAAEGVSTRSGQQGNKDVAVCIPMEHVSDRWYRSI